LCGKQNQMSAIHDQKSSIIDAYHYDIQYVVMQFSQDNFEQ
jgi:hypothetical protein